MSNNILLDQLAIKKILPHREPFLLIDEVNLCLGDNTAVTQKNITGDEWFFQGHFPHFPIMPGVLIIEVMAQTAAVFALYSLGEGYYLKPVYFLGINNAKFRAPVHPGNNIIISTKLKRKIQEIWIFSCQAKLSNNILLAEAEIMATLSNTLPS